MSPKEGAGYQEYCYAVLFLFRHCTMVSTTFSHVVDCVQNVTPHTAHVIHAGSMQPVADHSLAIMDALFAPFDAASFPKQLSVPQLTQLLEAPFATRVPLAPSILTASISRFVYSRGFYFSTSTGYNPVDSFAESLANRSSFCVSLHPILGKCWLWFP